MIYKLTFENGRIDWCTAKDQLHLLQSYDKNYNLPLQEIESLEEISDEEAKTIMLSNSNYDEDDPDEPEVISVYDSVISDDFCIIGSNEFDY